MLVAGSGGGDYNSRMAVLRAGDFREMPWKNGAGTTLELAVHPPGATVDDFDWRVSMARVDRSGPFSRFDGVDRTILLVEGDGFELIGPGWRTRLDRPLEPFRFDGAQVVECRLLGGPVRDFNVMTRRGRACHRVDVVRATRAMEGEALVYCVTGRAESAGEAIGPHELLQCEGGETRVDGTAILVQF